MTLMMVISYVYLTFSHEIIWYYPMLSYTMLNYTKLYYTVLNFTILY